MQEKIFKTEYAGRKLTVKTGHLAAQANSSCTVQYGDTVILATTVMSKDARDGVSFFPLMVEYEEKMYAAGRIKGSRFIKREARPTDEAILVARMIDRGLRPLFNEAIRCDIQVILTVLSIDGENDPDVPAIIAASIALHISDIPWNGPLVGVRVGQINGEWVLNPTNAAREKSTLDIAFSASADKVIMVEAAANEVDEKTAYEAFAFGLKHAKPMIKFIEDIRKEVGKEKMKLELTEVECPENLDDNQKVNAEEIAKLQEECKAKAIEKLNEFLFNIPKGSKRARKDTLHQVYDMLEEYLLEKQVGKERRKKVMEFFEPFIDEQITTAILERDQRVDGRKLNQIRPLEANVGLLPRTHGTGLFDRGETQVLSVVTLGAPGDEQTLDGMETSGKKRYMHHYNFPPYSVGEASPMRGTGRREIGHGALAEKALVPVLPDKDKFPYTIRVVSEVLGSNGSSSMASTCGSTLALMDAGVPITKPVAGIAMGMASNEKGDYKILTDIQDLEDGKGGMDFKIAGTCDGITAIQMDTKTLGISLEIIEKTLAQGKDARLEILDVITKAIPAPRAELSQYAPRIEILHINPEKIRDVIGPGGKMINKIIDETGVNIDIEQDGSVFITATEPAGMKKAVEWIQSLTKEAVVGDTYEGTVVKIMDFGAFVEIFPGTDGMVHVSEITDKERVSDVNKYLKVGQVIKVKVMKIDDQGRINLSMKKV
ncbi:MAG: Polyribonucleotide nucleotidyltransferase [Parcubacteria group bacterium GW2011_GWC2_39_14]|nr:MAG: Polyribonucleotide nucleotidyltransferase [Parcubacteria group bacterium GW2011_GWC2_39_14]KKR53442.1 MAG: Polyribonucleotide nucleotidyltransferase [Parcubacteria group bacterium GW2011_GWA2_40_23]